MEEQYEVDQIVEKRFRKGQVEYLVQWKNYEDPKETVSYTHLTLPTNREV